MIELDEKDVREVAWGRYVRKTRKKFLVIALPFVLLTFVAYAYLAPTSLSYLAVIPPAIGIILFLLWGRRIGKYQAMVVKEWKNAGRSKE